MPRRRKRKSSTRRKFLKKRGLKKTPRGKAIHHKRSLSKGGSDSLRNLSLIKKSRHKKLTRKLLKKRRGK